MKKLSVVALIRCKNTFLIGRAPNHDKWDVIKGEHEPDESYIDTAIREAKEECGIELTFKDCTYAFGPFPYLTGKHAKDLCLCRFDIEEYPTELKCTSTFEMYGKQFPEVVEYKWVTWDEKDKYLYPNLVKALNKQFTFKIMYGSSYECV